MSSRSSETVGLRYLNARRIEGPLSTFDHLDVRSSEGRKVGRLDGIIIDPAEQRLRYLVVDEAGFLKHRRYLLPLSRIRVDAEQPALWVDDVDSCDLHRCKDFDPASFPRFSDNDLNGGDHRGAATSA